MSQRSTRLAFLVLAVTASSALLGACGGEPADACDGAECVAPTCSDQIQNGDETGTDCGGGCASCPDACASAPCKNGGRCVVEVGVFVCECASGFGGPTCETSEACLGRSCGRGTCVDDGGGSHHCDCPAGEFDDGTTCRACAPITDCAGTVTCTTDDDSTCSACAPGRFGPDCAACSPRVGCTSVTCAALGASDCTACAAGYVLEGATCSDSDACASNPCGDGGTCTDLAAPAPDSSAGRTCACAAGRYLDGPTCAPCTPIAQCAGALTCTTDDDSTCSACALGTFGAAGGTRCDACPDVAGCVGAVTCDALGVSACSACEPGRFGPDCAACSPRVGCTSITCAALGASSCTACAAGYVLDGATCSDIDACASNPCGDGGTCTDLAAPAPDSSAGRTCVCAAGRYFDGATCTPCTPIAQCAGALTCTTDDDSTCSACAPGTFGAAGGTRCDACPDVAGCVGAVTCDALGVSACSECEPGRFGPDCAVCSPRVGCTSVTCAALGASSCTTCAAGYERDGATCRDSDACASNPCGVGGTCTDRPAPAPDSSAGRTCACAAGRYLDGPTCAPCTTITHCAGALTCTSDDDSKCGACEPGYFGPDCAVCAPRVGCTSITCAALGASQCTACAAGYVLDGATCSDIDACASNPCGVGGTCTDRPAPAPDSSAGRTCVCAAGSYLDGPTCAPCTPIAHCVGALTCTTDDSTCSTCEPGYVGPDCAACSPLAGCASVTCAALGASSCTACAPGYALDGATCGDIDACVDHPCGVGATCADRVAPAPDSAAGRTCACGPGFALVGDGCVDIDACASHPCDDDATCVDRAAAPDAPAGRRCTCDPGFVGDGEVCSDIDACVDHPCQPGADCADRPGAPDDASGRSCTCVADTDEDGTLDCDDACPDDPGKRVGGTCGCGVPDDDADHDTYLDCLEDGACGDAIVQPGESCDLGASNALGASCYPDCQTPFLPYRTAAPVGNYLVEGCPTGTVVVGLRYTPNADGQVTWAQLACRARSGDALAGPLVPLELRARDTVSNQLGLDGVPAPYDDATSGDFLRCDDVVSDAVVVGQRLWLDDTSLQHLGAVCASMSTGARFVIGPDTLPTPRVAIPPDHQDACPQGFAVVGWKGLFDQRLVRRLALVCEPERSDGDPFGDPIGRDLHPDADLDGDGVINQADPCHADPDKVTPGFMGCGVPELDSDDDAVPDAFDQGLCGDGVVQLGETCDDGDGNMPVAAAAPDGTCLDDCTRRGGYVTDLLGAEYSPSIIPCPSDTVVVGWRYTQLAFGEAPFGTYLDNLELGSIQLVCRARAGRTLVGPPLGQPSHGYPTAGRLPHPRRYDAARPEAGPYLRCDTLHPDGVVVGMRVWFNPNYGVRVWHVGPICQRLGDGTRYFVGVDQQPGMPWYGASYGASLPLALPSATEPSVQALCSRGAIARGYNYYAEYGTNFAAGLSCVDLDACADHPCGMNASCTDLRGADDAASGRTCTCNSGFAGDGATCVAIDACVDHPCHADATCADLPGLPNDPSGRTCTCDPGLEGDGESCHPPWDACVDHPCDANAACQDLALAPNAPSGRTCTCDAGFEGDGETCADIDACDDHPCPAPMDCIDLSAAPNLPAGRECACVSDSDGDGASDCDDGCPNNPEKRAPTACGCALGDADSDNDTVLDCVDSGACGDGVVQFGESCDLGVANALGAPCYPDCQAPRLPSHLSQRASYTFRTRCPIGSVAVGLRYMLNDFDEVTYAQLACRARDGDALSGPVVALPLIGFDTQTPGDVGVPAGNDASGAFLRCDDVFPDARLVGQRTWFKLDVEQRPYGFAHLGGVCARMSSGARFVIGPDTLPAPLVTTRPHHQDACPQGLGVDGWHGNQEQRGLFELAFTCEPERTSGDIFGDPSGPDVHADEDLDGDGVINQADVCHADPNKVTPGFTGCGVAELDDDGDGVPNAFDSGFCGDGTVQRGESCDAAGGNVPPNPAASPGTCFTDCTRARSIAGLPRCPDDHVLVGWRYGQDAQPSQYGAFVLSELRGLQAVCRRRHGRTLIGPPVGLAPQGAVASYLPIPLPHDPAAPNEGPYMRCDTLHSDGVVAGARAWVDPTDDSGLWHLGAMCQRLGSGARYLIGVDQYPGMPLWKRFRFLFDPFGAPTSIVVFHLPDAQQPTWQMRCTTGSFAVGVSGTEVFCQDIGACADHPCDPNASCDDLAGETNAPSGRVCTCDAGFIGDGETCAAIDACVDHPCHPDATCTDLPGLPNAPNGRTCACEAGFEGDGITCVPYYDACLDHPCAANATCADLAMAPNTASGRTCTCELGFEYVAEACVDVDACEDHPCPGVMDCIDRPGAPNLPEGRECACISDSDGDGVIDCADGCPENPDKLAPTICGCTLGDDDRDSDNDTVRDCHDVGTCGDGVVQLGESCDLGAANALGASCYPDCQTPHLPYSGSHVAFYAFDERCAAGSVAVGLRYLLNNYDEATFIQLACRVRAGDTLSGPLIPLAQIGLDVDELSGDGVPAPYSDPSSGTFLRCDEVFPDAMMVGQRFWREWNLMHLGAVCERISTGERFVIGPDTLPEPRVSTRPLEQHACPRGLGVSGWRGMQDERLVAVLAFTCEREHTAADIFGDPGGRDLHADSDLDGDGVVNQADVCHADPAKVTPGFAGCGVVEVDGDDDAVPDAFDSGFCGDGVQQFGEACDAGASNVPLDQSASVGACLEDCTRAQGPTTTQRCAAGDVLVGWRYGQDALASPYGGDIRIALKGLQPVCRKRQGRALSGAIIGLAPQPYVPFYLPFPRAHDALAPNEGPYMRCDTIHPDGVVVGARSWRDPIDGFFDWHISPICQRLGDGVRYLIGVDQYLDMPQYRVLGFVGAGFFIVGLPDRAQATAQTLCTTGSIAVGQAGAGVVCEDIDACPGNACDTNATCVDLPNAANDPSGRVCTCDAGFEGDGETCVDIDACVAHPCEPGLTCIDLDGAPDDASGRVCECGARDAVRESFDYAAGALGGLTGGDGWASPWSHTYTPGGLLAVMSPGLTYPGLATVGNRARFSSGGTSGIAQMERDVPRRACGRIYVQFLSRLNQATSGGGTPNLRLYDSAVTNGCSNTLNGGFGNNGGTTMCMLGNQPDNGCGLRTNTAVSSCTGAPLSNLNLTIVRIDYDLQRSEIWVNPTLGTFDYAAPPAASAVWEGFAPTFDRVEMLCRTPCEFDEIEIFDAP